jgi:transposase
MEEYISFDSHKHYTLMERQPVAGGRARRTRIEHAPGAIRAALAGCSPGTAVAVEATGNWYWIIQEIEQAGLSPRLVHPRKAKLMMGMINATDRLAVDGMNRLQRNGTLPTVWIPGGELRDLRELTRGRLRLTRRRTQLKNIISSMLSKYGLQMTGFSDTFGRKARPVLEKRIAMLPEHSGYITRMHVDEVDEVTKRLGQVEKALDALVQMSPEMQLLTTMPGVAVILATTIALEVGEVDRFPDAEHLASYAGTTPRVHSSGGKTRYGRTRPDVNRHLKWAYAEAGNSVAVNYQRRPERHVSKLYKRLRQRKNHSIAVGAVARHLAEATYWVLSKKESYRDPALPGRG